MDDKNLALTIADLASEKQAQGLEIIDVSSVADYTDFVLVCGGRSERQVRAIAEAIQVGLKKQEVQALGVEGLSQGHWVLLDYGNVVVHVFHEHARGYYDIEGLWMDADRIPFEEMGPPEVTAASETRRGRCASGS